LKSSSYELIFIAAFYPVFASFFYFIPTIVLKKAPPFP
jgi:hypothetical protein